MVRRNFRIGAMAAALAFYAGTLFNAPEGTRAGEPASPEFYVPGSLSFTLDPPDALWQIALENDQGAVVTREDGWRPSGQVESSLPPGRYLIAFRAPAGYSPPDPIPVIVHGGAQVSRRATFPRSSLYARVQDIPPQVVRHGDTLRFGVAESASLVSFDPPSDPSIQRDLSFAGGVFNYRPVRGEREQFTVTFSASGGGTRAVLVTPQGRLPAEESVIEFKGDFLPIDLSAERAAYLSVLVVEKIRTAQEGPLNLREDLKARQVTISGPRVVFARDHENRLFSSFGYDETQHPVADIESLSVYADEVIIRGALRLPETDVTIYARELRFEDGSEAASLNTTPLKKPGRPDLGVRGHDAGDISLNVESVHAPGGAVRLILKGGDGQEAKEGENGTALPAPKQFDTYVPPLITAACITGNHTSADIPTSWKGRVIFWKNDAICAATIERNRVGTLSCPRSGMPATANGVPGNGGNGGVLTCPFDLEAISSTSGGRAGQSQPERFGSAGDSPYNALQIYNYFNCLCQWDGWKLYTSEGAKGECKNVPGAGRPATQAPGPAPQGGEVRIEPAPFQWLHPVAIRALLTFAKDAYLNGYPDEARGLLEPYAAALEAHTVRPGDLDLDQLQDEIETLLRQIDSHLDFFGFPAGWVPMLSFEVNLDLFQDEVQAAGDLLYLSHYLGLEADKAVNKLAALERVRREIAEEIKRSQSELDQTQERLRNLSIQAQVIDRAIADLRAELVVREEALRGEAERVAALKKAFRVAGNVLPLIPVGQPALGLAGAGFTAASRFNEQSALDASIEGTNLAHVFLEQHLDDRLQDFQTALCTNPAACDLQAAFQAQQTALQGLDAGLVAVNRTLVEVKTWESDVDKEIQILAAEDPQHKDLVRKVRDLNARKRRFAEDMVVALQGALKLAAGINQGFLALDNLNRSSVKESGRIDQAAFAYIKEMGQRAKERLLKFQYYMIKAYQYRVVRPYDQIPGGDKAFQLKDVFQHFEDNFTDTFDPQIGAAILNRDVQPNLLDIYTEQVRAVTADIVAYMNTETPEQTQTLFVELSPEELAKLNSWDDSSGDNPEGDLRINLVARGGLFDQRQENLRIFKLEVDTLEVSPASGTRKTNVTVHLRHSGESLVSSKGETYKFNHYRTLKSAPISWRGIYNSTSNTLSTPQLSASTVSLLKALLPADQQSDLVLYSRPAARADLIVTKETPGDPVMLVNRLVLRLSVDFSEKESQAEVEVDALGTDGEPLAPNILVEDRDENLRADGRGSFRRVFRPGQRVHLRAQESHGGYAFDRWINRRGETLGTELVLAADLPLSVSATVSRFTAVYRYRAGGGVPFRRGEINDDGAVDLSDAIFLLNALFTGGSQPACRKAADVNDDAGVDISDGISLLAFLFTGGAIPPAPYGACGSDLTPDALGCESQPSCEPKP